MDKRGSWRKTVQAGFPSIAHHRPQGDRLFDVANRAGDPCIQGWSEVRLFQHNVALTPLAGMGIIRTAFLSVSPPLVVRLGSAFVWDLQTSCFAWPLRRSSRPPDIAGPRSARTGRLPCSEIGRGRWRTVLSLPQMAPAPTNHPAVRAAARSVRSWERLKADSRANVAVGQFGVSIR